jgi:acetyl esterase/lipase
MPLDPQAKALLDRLVALRVPPLSSMSPQQARELFSRWFLAVRDKGEPVGKLEDRKVPGPGGEIPVRIYFPRNKGGILPVFVYFHGGGFVLGDIESSDSFCRTITNTANCIVISVEYRLAPEHKFPAAVEDAYASTKWAATNARSFSGDSSRIAVGGDSAGGNLATVVCLMAKELGGPKVIYQVLIYPAVGSSLDSPSAREYGEGYFLTRDDMVWFSTNYLRNEKDLFDPHFAPLLAEDLQGLPGALIITGEFDPIRDNGEAYAKRLSNAGVPVKLSRYDGMIHGFVSMAGVLDQGTKAISQIASDLRIVFGVAEGKFRSQMRGLGQER